MQGHILKPVRPALPFIVRRRPVLFETITAQAGADGECQSDVDVGVGEIVERINRDMSRHDAERVQLDRHPSTEDFEIMQAACRRIVDCEDDETIIGDTTRADQIDRAALELVAGKRDGTLDRAVGALIEIISRFAQLTVSQAEKDQSTVAREDVYRGEFHFHFSRLLSAFSLLGPTSAGITRTLICLMAC